MFISFFSLSFELFKESDKTIILKYDAIYNGVMNVLNEINLGYVCQNGQKKLIIDNDFDENYSLQNAKDVLENKIGLCFDQVELERELISKMNVDSRTYYMYYLENDNAHAFLVYKDNDKYYWFEHAWLKYRGIHVYESKRELIRDIVNKYCDTIENCKRNKIKIYDYQKPRKGINYIKFKSNALNGIIIK